MVNACVQKHAKSCIISACENNDHDGFKKTLWPMVWQIYYFIATSFIWNNKFGPLFQDQIRMFKWHQRCGIWESIVVLFKCEITNNSKWWLRFEVSKQQWTIFNVASSKARAKKRRQWSDIEWYVTLEGWQQGLWKIVNEENVNAQNLKFHK